MFIIFLHLLFCYCVDVTVMETSRRSFMMQVHPRYNHVSSCHTDKDPRFPLPPRWYYLNMWHWSLTFWSSDCQEHQRALQTEFWSFKRGKKVLNGSDYDTKCTWAINPHCSLQTDFLFSFGSNFSVHLRNYHPHLNCANFPLNEVFFISASLFITLLFDCSCCSLGSDADTTGRKPTKAEIKWKFFVSRHSSNLSRSC